MTDEEFIALCEVRGKAPTVSCMMLMDTAKSKGIPVSELGKQANRLSVKIRECRLGLMKKGKKLQISLSPPACVK